MRTALTWERAFVVVFVALNLYSFACAVGYVSDNYIFVAERMKFMRQAEFVFERTDWKVNPSVEVDGYAFLPCGDGDGPHGTSFFAKNEGGSAYLAYDASDGVHVIEADTGFWQTMYQKVAGNDHRPALTILALMVVEALVLSSLDEGGLLLAGFTVFRYCVFRLGIVLLMLLSLFDDIVRFVSGKMFCVVVLVLWVLVTDFYSRNLLLAAWKKKGG